MNNEDRLRSLLREAAVDPGAKQDWEGFRRTAHRNQLVRRAAFVGGIAALAALIVITSSALRDGLFDQSLPDPVDRDRRQENVDENTDEDTDENVDDDDGDELQLRIERDAEELENRLDNAPPGLRRGGRPGIAPPPGTDEEDERPPAPEDDRGRDDEQIVRSFDGCREETPTIYGTNGDDILSGTPGRDVIMSFAGDDVVRGLGAGDYICAGEGNDKLYGDEGNDSLLGGPGDDVMNGGEGTFDLVEFPGVDGIEADLGGAIQGEGLDVAPEVEVVVGTVGDDELTGDGKDNWLFGNAGNDSMYGAGRDDMLEGGPGNDEIFGAAGTDVALYWTSGSSGRPGVNVDLSALSAVGEGVDRVGNIEQVVGGSGDDVLSGDGGDNLLNGHGGNDTVSGAGGDDLLLGGAGDDKLDGGPGTDSTNGGTEIDTCTNTEERVECEAGPPVASAGRSPRAPAVVGRTRRRRGSLIEA